MSKPLHRRAAQATLSLAAGRPLRLAASGAALALACAGIAQAQNAARTYAIPAGTLEAVLSRYAVDSGLMLSYSAGDIAGKRSAGLAGSHAAPAALARILAGTGLEALPQPNGGYVLRPLPTGRNETPTLAPVTVSGAGLETALGPVQGFFAKRSATATKTDTPLHETPQSVAVIPRDQMVAQAADSLDQALGYTAGVMSLEGGGLRNIGTRFTVRGFNITGAAPLYLNGAKFPINSLSGGIEPYLYERVELLKGPASILYGQAAPGGIINLVTKLPTAEPLRELELQAGSWNKKQIAADFGGPLSEDGRVRYRLTGLARDSDTMVRRIDNDRAALAGALAWQLTDATTLTLLASYNRIRNPYDSGKPLDGTLLSNPYGRVSRKAFLGEPGSDHFDVTGATYGYMLEHRLNDSWQLRQNLMAYDYKADNKYTAIEARVIPATPRLAWRELVARNDTDKGLAVDNQLIGKLRHGAFEHTLLFGADWSALRWTRSQRIASLTPIDMYDPTYGGPVVFNPAYDRRMNQRGRQLGFYAQDQIKIDGRWIVLLGGRYDKARNDSGDGPEKSHAFTPRAGLMYLFDNGLAPYYSYSKSFQPTSGADFSGNPFRPTTGVQHEVGLKYEPPGADASVTLALYDITQRNVLTSDPAHAGFLSQSGEVRSRGAEIEARASLNRQWDLLASFALIDAEVTKSNHGTQGTRPPSVPNNMATLWADYRFSGVPGLSAGFGVRHVGRQETNRMPVPSYTTYDAALRYQWEKWQFALNIKNLTDKTYVSACPGVCYYGDERNITLTARLNW